MTRIPGRRSVESANEWVATRWCWKQCLMPAEGDSDGSAIIRMRIAQLNGALIISRQEDCVWSWFDSGVYGG